MSTSHGYSDRISHAFAFAAKHLPSRPRRGSGALHLTQPANVAVILARYGCDEITIISGILSHLVNEASFAEPGPTGNKIGEKFGTMVSEVIGDVVEPRYDSRGRERNLGSVPDGLSRQPLRRGTPRARHLRRQPDPPLWLNPDRHSATGQSSICSAYAEAPAEQTLWWYGSVITALEAVHRRPADRDAPRIEGLIELLARELEQQGG